MVRIPNFTLVLSACAALQLFPCFARYGHGADQPEPPALTSAEIEVPDAEIASPDQADALAVPDDSPVLLNHDSGCSCDSGVSCCNQCASGPAWLRPLGSYERWPATSNNRPLIRPLQLPGRCAPWRIDAGVYLLDRSGADPLPLIRNQGTGQPLLDARDLDSELGAFPYLRLIHEDVCSGWDIGVWGGDGWDDERNVGDPVSPAFVGAGLVVLSTAPFATFDVQTGTEIFTADANYRHRLCDNLTLIAGFRYLELGDDLAITQNQGGANPVLNVDTNNYLYGFQLGLDALLLSVSDRWIVEGSVRGAIMRNHADQNTFAPYVTGVPGFVNTARAQSDDDAFFAGLGVQSVYMLNQRWSLVGGYQMFWIEQVALAPSQIPVTNLAIPATAGIDNNSGLFLHGANIGLSCTF